MENPNNSEIALEMGNQIYDMHKRSYIYNPAGAAASLYSEIKQVSANPPLEEKRDELSPSKPVDMELVKPSVSAEALAVTFEKQFSNESVQSLFTNINDY